MSTPNFYNKNASLIFASQCEEEWDYEDLKLNIVSEMEAIEKEKGGIQWNGHETSKDECSRGATLLGCLYADKTYNGMTVEVTVAPLIRSGYFAGVNLDWEIEYHIEGYAHDSIEDIDFECNFPHRTEQYEEWVTAYLETTAEELIEKVEKVFKDYTTPLVCVGVASNGEAFYEKAENKRSMNKAIANDLV